MSDYGKVYTITEWYDGARGGIADLDGEPYYYENHWNDEKNGWNEIYFLKLLDAETFALAMEDWAIWLRWEQAYKEGKTAHETHPALPSERQRHDELSAILAERLVLDRDASVKAKADFVYGNESKVKWTVID